MKIDLNAFQDSENTPCVSVIIPTHKTSPERTVDPIVVDKVIKQAKDALVLKYGNNGTLDLGKKLEVLSKEIDFVHSNNGLGLYVSEGIAEMVVFPFPVKEKIVVGERFDLRELHFLQSYMEDYLFLSLTMDMVRLYKGNGSRLKEIINEDFPRKFMDDYIYEKPAVADRHNNALKSTEKDKSVMTEIRFQRFLNDIDKSLSPYLNGNNIPFIVGGVKEELGFFNKVSKHTHRIAGTIEGNYTYSSPAEIGEMAFERIKRYRDKVSDNEIKKLREAVGKEMAVTGIRNVWRAAQEGKGLLLMVESDFSKPGFIREGDEINLFLSPPVEKHDIIPDVIEAIIDIVKQKQGNVLIVNDGKLTEYDQIALILRYP